MTRIGYEFEFTSGVHDGESLIMNLYQFRIQMLILDEGTGCDSIAFSRVKHFILNHIDNTIFIEGSKKDQCRKLIDAGLNITTLPLEPVDQVINIMLFHKLNAIMENRVVIDQASLQSIYGGSIEYFYEAENAAGPFLDDGWWNDANLVHCDSKLLGENIVDMHHSAVWRDLDLQWPAEVNQVDQNTVVTGNFKRDD